MELQQKYSTLVHNFIISMFSLPKSLLGKKIFFRFSPNFGALLHSFDKGNLLLFETRIQQYHVLSF